MKTLFLFTLGLLLPAPASQGATAVSQGATAVSQGASAFARPAGAGLGASASPEAVAIADGVYLSHDPRPRLEPHSSQDPRLSYGTPPSLDALADSRQWQRLLYFKRHWFSGWKSALDGDGFFLSPAGQRDPRTELVATVAALERGGGSFGKKQQPIHCAFPLRRIFLEEKLGKKFPGGPCPDLDEYLAKLDPAGVALAFATAYPSNPASMFGHSFLKISRRPLPGRSALLDWSINYAAMVPPDENAFAFTYFGLAGGYAGQFTLVPYYAKIEEYGNQEGRDIWEYELNLSPAEQRRLLLAIWEIETNSYLNYFFFDENCSFQLLTLLEVARPDWELSDYFIHMIPGESVKKVARVPGAVTRATLRPSLERRLRAAAAGLDHAGRAELGAARAGSGLQGVGAPALGAYLLYLQAEKKRRGAGWGGADEARLRAALAERAGRGEAAPEADPGGQRTRPDLSHGAYALGLGPTLEQKKLGGELSLRMAYHDLIDADPGYLAHSEILFPNLRLRYSSGRLRVEEVQAVSIVSLTPWNMVRRPISWRVRGGWRRLWESCGECRGVSLEAGAGFALAPLPERWTLWSMLGAEGTWSERFSAPRGEPWVELGSLATLPGEGKFLLRARGARFLGEGGQWRGLLHGGFSQPLSQNFALRIEAEWAKKEQEAVRSTAKILAVHYF